MSSPFAGFVWTLSYSPELEDMFFFLLTGVGRQAGQISFFLQGKVPFTFTIAMSFSKRPRPDGWPLFSPRIGVWAVNQRKFSWRRTFFRKDRRLCCEYLLDYFCRLKTDFIRIHRTWGVCVDSLGSARYQDIFRIRLSLKFRIN